MSLIITPLSEEHFIGLHQVYDSIAREKSYLPVFLAEPFENCVQSFRKALIPSAIHFVAVINDQIIGWCDIIQKTTPAFNHVGELGIGLISSARHQGIGKLLITQAIKQARTTNLTRIELTVRSDNHVAKKMYLNMGFNIEGSHKNAFLVDGQYYDVDSMALLF